MHTHKKEIFCTKEDKKNISSILHLLILYFVIRDSLNISYMDLERTKEEIDMRSNSIRQGNNDIRALQMGVDKLKQKIDNLKKNATDVQAQDVEGMIWLVAKI